MIEDDLTTEDLASIANSATVPAYARRMAAELSRRRETDGWRPISEAPRDGSVVDLWIVCGDDACRAPGMWWDIDRTQWRDTRFHMRGNPGDWAPSHFRTPPEPPHDH